MKVLGVSTSTPRGSVALVQDHELLGQYAYRGEMQHAERLFAIITEVLTAANVAKGELDAVACDLGPGSFTGVRAWLAGCKGLAFGLGIPLVGVSSLQAMATAAFAEPVSEGLDRLIPMIDAKRKEVFFAIFDRERGLLVGPDHVRTNELLTTLANEVARPGVALVGELGSEFEIDVTSTSLLRGDNCDLPDAAWIARCGEKQIADSQLAALADIEPIYVRAPDAKLPAAAFASTGPAKRAP